MKGNAPNIRPVTFVLSNNGGDFALTQAGLVAAIAALPTGGGKIVLREGTLSLTTSISLPNKNITIEGAGMQGTVIDLGSNAIYAFEADYTGAALQVTELTGLTIQGNGTASQKGIRLDDQGFVTTFIFRDVYFKNMDAGIREEGCGGVNMQLCLIHLADRDGVYHIEGPGADTYWISDCQFENVNGAKKRGGISGGGFAYISNSRIDCGTDVTLTHVQITGSRFAADGSTGGSTPKLVSVGNTRGAMISGCEFRGGAYLEITNAGPWAVTGCVWHTSPPAICLDIPAAADAGSVSDCIFPDATTAAIRTANTTGVAIVGCVFAATGAHNTVLEAGSADLTRAEGCVGLGSGAGVSFVGAGSRVDGVQLGNGNGSLTVGHGVGKIYGAVANVATSGTVKETLATLTIPANTLNINGRQIRITAYYSTAANGNNKTAGIDFDGTQVCSSGAIALNNGVFVISSLITRTSAGNQETVGEAQAGATAIAPQRAATTKDETGNLNITLWATTPTASGDATLGNYIVEVL